MVFATQNPVDYEGTFALPESQLDRFLMCLQMGYPQPQDELEILRSTHTAYDDIAVKPVATSSEIRRLQEVARQVFVEDSVLDYVLKIVAATRTEVEFHAGVSVRGGLALKLAAQSRALVRGRDFVVPEDVGEVVAPVLVHRLSLVRASADALEERRTVASVLKRIVASIAAPV
jgi:MoxR-like ATPase